jgi:hypothetical protein
VAYTQTLEARPITIGMLRLAWGILASSGLAIVGVAGHYWKTNDRFEAHEVRFAAIELRAKAIEGEAKENRVFLEGLKESVTQVTTNVSMLVTQIEKEAVLRDRVASANLNTVASKVEDQRRLLETIQRQVEAIANGQHEKK